VSWGRDTRLFLTAPLGTEKALKAELRDLGLGGAKGARGGVRVKGGVEAITRICSRSRIAVRCLIELDTFACGDERALDRGMSAIAWERWLTPERTLAIRATSKRSRLDHTGFLAQRAKDAVVDRQRQRFGRRSSVDKRDPDVGIVLRLDADRATVLLDASGQSLHRRGWRLDEGEAPLKENLAAAILRMSGWDRERLLVDPFCGAGTIPIEAELWSRDAPAQPGTRRFGFERWADHDAAAQARAANERASGRSRQRERGAPVEGSDRDPDLIRAAQSNGNRANSRARFTTRDAADVDPIPAAHIVANPPYGERLEAVGIRRFLAKCVTSWRERHHVSLLLPEDLDVPVRGPTPRSQPLFNGPLRCQLVTWSPD